MNDVKMVHESEIEIRFNLILENDLTLRLHIVSKYFGWKWYYDAKGPYLWLDFIVVDKRFIPENKNVCSEEFLLKINNGFYQILQELKTNPEYRLKVLNILDPEIIEIWKSVKNTSLG